MEHTSRASRYSHFLSTYLFLKLPDLRLNILKTFLSLAKVFLSIFRIRLMPDIGILDASDLRTPVGKKLCHGDPCLFRNRECRSARSLKLFQRTRF